MSDLRAFGKGYVPICKHCGKTEDEHCHDGFEQKMPDGCQCDPGTWGDVKPICAEYRPAAGADSYCASCEHDAGCHLRPPSKSTEPK